MNTASARLGYYSSLIAFVAAVGYSIAQILQVLGVVTFPLDAVLIYSFSLFIAVPFMLAVLALHYSVTPGKKIWSHAALLFTIIYVTYVVLNYVVQLATVIPATINGTLNDIRVLDQTPHSFFWDVDGLGYIFMGLASLFISRVFAKQDMQRWVRAFFFANALITPVIALIYFYPHFSITLLLFGLPWVITAPGSMLLLARFFGRALKTESNSILNGQEETLQVLVH